MAVNKIVWNRPVLDNFLRSESGEVGRWLMGIGRDIKVNAVAKAGYKTGALKSSITLKHNRTFRGQSITVGSPLNYALYHHQGTKPHIITPRRANQLVFMTPRGTGGMRLVRTQIVRHPGTRPNPFLTEPMRIVLAGKGVV